MKVALSIRKIRQSLRMTQSQFCALYNSVEPKELTIDQPLLSKYESGDVIPPGDKLLKFQSLK
jgi:transcriptional regulator with XRE-family HTH domain